MPFYRRFRQRVNPEPAAITTVPVQETVNYLASDGSLCTHLYKRTAAAAAAAAPTSFNPDSYAKVYNFPAPAAGAKPVIAVISLGGGLYGTVDKTTGILTGGDVQASWTSIGIPAARQPTVVVIPVAGAVNTPSTNDNGATEENCLDVEIVGANCPGSTILFYLAPLSYNGFYAAFSAAIARNPSVISCSWGGPEFSWSPSDLARFNALFATAAAKGINICCASGDDGSSNGGVGMNVDFPASSPNVVAVGGTTLTCPQLKYNAATTEITWSRGGGGVSRVFTAPACQVAALKATKRAVPDVALNSDPKTGIKIVINKTTVVLGGTSCAAPAMAAFIAAAGINYFLTPRLYKAKNPAASFHDIKKGSNGAYTASTGYDKCTGLGSIDGVALKANL
jgi:kumamolisin